MRKFISEVLTAEIIIGTFLCSSINAQNTQEPSLRTTGVENMQNSSMSTIHNVTQLSDQKQREMMRADGLSDSVIDKLMEKRKALSLKEKKATVEKNNGSDDALGINATCGNMGGENGWNSWVGATGVYDNGVVTLDVTGISPPTGPRFNLTTGTGTDICTGGAGGGPLLPVVAPGFGTTSIQLGQPRTTGNGGNCPTMGCVERLTYPFLVTAADTNFIYAYAIVIENPIESPPTHTGKLVPYAEIYILDPNGAIIPCSHQKYLGDTTGLGTVQPGFYAGTCVNDVVYKPWTTVGVNLSNYVGKILSVVITNADCGLGGHFCYSYWDFACPPINSSSPTFCLGNSITLLAPPSDPQNPYTYQWYQNGVPMPNATGISIIPTPKIGDLFSVHVHQNSNCDFWVPYIPKPITITPSITAMNKCGTVDFTGSATTSDGAQITQWIWNFGGATPNTSTAQNPTGIVYPAQGTYTVTLTVTSKTGCQQIVKKVISTLGTISANFSVPPVCQNTVSKFTGTSTDVITQWDWNFGDGSVGTGATPTHTYASCGVYTSTLIVTGANAGCKDTIVQPVTINCFPKSSFSSTTVCYGNPTLFSDLSTLSSGNITGWIWDFGDPNSGVNNTSSLSSPSHVFTQPNSYNVILTVTSDKGCQSISTYPVTFSPPPVALFSSTSVCLNTPTNFTSNSTSVSDPINSWDWNYGDGSAHGSGTAPVHAYSTAGNYTVGLIVTTVGGCKDTVENPVTVYGIPVANYSDPAQGCAPVCATFKNQTLVPTGESIATWQWDCPGGTPAVSSDKDPSFCWNTPGTYDVQLIVISNHGCRDTMITPQYIHVYSWPHADFCVAPLIAPSTDPVFNFCDKWTSNVSNWVWDFGDNSTLDTSNTNPVHSYSAAATNNDFYKYTICLHVETPHGCADSICKEVNLLPEFTFYIPNTFSPNEDNLNDLFYGKSRGVKDYNIWIFDRWGNQVWDCHHTGKNTDWDATEQEGMSSFCRWDGKVVQGGLDMNGRSGQFSQEDVYVWKVQLTDIFGKHHSYVGHVNIIR